MLPQLASWASSRGASSHVLSLAGVASTIVVLVAVAVPVRFPLADWGASPVPVQGRGQSFNIVDASC